MNREGVDESQIKDFLKVLESNSKVRITGVLSHLHSADEVYHDCIEQQIVQFKKLYMEIINA
jgi:alanine racemase